MKIKTAYKLIFASAIFLMIAVVVTALVKAVKAAECESTYGGGEICLVNKRFEIEKQVRIKDSDDDWEDKVMDVEEDDIVEFRIKIKNLSDDEAEEITDFDDMKMEDFLPKQMYRVGGSGLTEYWDDFAPGETKTFEIEAQIDEDEFDNDETFEKCIVNKAEVTWDGEFEGADTATVCYGDEEITELPDTGSNEIISLLGLVSIVSGFIIKKSLKYTA